jgi:hypothetical protein
MRVQEACSVYSKYISDGGRPLAEVRDAAGHSNVTVTSGYLHVVVEEDGVGALFA